MNATTNFTNSPERDGGAGVGGHATPAPTQSVHTAYCASFVCGVLVWGGCTSRGCRSRCPFPWMLCWTAWWTGKAARPPLRRHPPTPTHPMSASRPLWLYAMYVCVLCGMEVDGTVVLSGDRCPWLTAPTQQPCTAVPSGHSTLARSLQVGSVPGNPHGVWRVANRRRVLHCEGKVQEQAFGRLPLTEWGGVGAHRLCGRCCGHEGGGPACVQQAMFVGGGRGCLCCTGIATVQISPHAACCRCPRLKFWCLGEVAP